MIFNFLALNFSNWRRVIVTFQLIGEKACSPPLPKEFLCKGRCEANEKIIKTSFSSIIFFNHINQALKYGIKRNPNYTAKSAQCVIPHLEVSEKFTEKWCSLGALHFESWPRIGLYGRAKLVFTMSPLCILSLNLHDTI